MEWVGGARCRDAFGEKNLDIMLVLNASGIILRDKKVNNWFEGKITYSLLCAILVQSVSE